MSRTLEGRSSGRTFVVRVSRKLRMVYRLRSGVSRLLGRLLAGFLATLATAFLSTVYALPGGGVVQSGVVTINTPTANAMVVNQGSAKAIIDWNTFSIGTGQSVQFLQPSSSSVALNRVVGGDVSSIFGTLTANGQVFLVNPAGVMFAPGAQVNVGGLVASSLNIGNADFLAGNYSFSGTGGSVVNNGAIRAGYVALAAPQVTNAGSIDAPRGSVGLLAGSRVTVDPSGAGLVKFSVDAAAVDAAVTNSGTITADGGQVLVAASAIGDAMATVINQSGVIRANSVAEQNGTIVLSGGSTGIVKVTGTLEARGANAGETGGTVKVLGDKVGIGGTAVVDASGDAGGGTVLVGGNWQGNGAEQNASAAAVATGARLSADAGSTGHGGTVVVWSDGSTAVGGAISARGGATGGNGGQVETSGKGSLVVAGSTTVDTSAPHGAVGNWLLDPTNIVVGTGGAAALGDVDQFGDAGATVTIAPATINPSATRVTLQATSDITFNNAVSMTTNGAGLTAQAGRNITVNAGIGTNNGSIILSANDPGTTRASGRVAVNAAINAGQAAVNITNNGSVNTNTLAANVSGLGITVAGDSSLGNNVALNAGGGSLSLGNVTGNGNGLTLTANGGATAGAVSGLASLDTNVRNVTTTVGGVFGVYSIGTNLSATSVSTSSAALGGNVTATGGLSLGTTTVSNNVTLTGQTVTTWNISAPSNDLTINATTGDISTFDIAARNLTLTASPGSVIYTGTETISGNYSVTAGDFSGSLSPIFTGASSSYSITDTSGGLVQSAVSAPGTVSLTMTNGGSLMLLGGGVTSTTGNVNLTAAGGISLAGPVTANGSGATIAINGPTQLIGDTTLTASGTATLNGTVDGSYGLTVNAGGAVVNGAIGANSALTNLALNGPTTLGGNVTTTGGQRYGDITLTGNASLQDAGGLISTGNVSGAGRTLTVSETGGSGTVNMGTVNVAGLDVAAGTQVSATSIAATGASNVGGDVTTAAGQSYGSVSLSGSVKLQDTSGAGLSLGSSVAGNGNDLHLVSGNARSTGAISGVNTLTTNSGTNLTAQGVSAANAVLGGNVTTTGAAGQVYGATTVAANGITLNAGAANPISLGNVTTSGGANNLTLTGQASMGQTIANLGVLTANQSLGTGGPIFVGSLSVGGAATLGGNVFSTNGGQAYNGPVTLGADVAVQSTFGAITFNGTVDGAHSLAVNTPAATTFAGAVGATTALTSLSTDAGGTTTLGANVTTTGAQAYNDNVVLGSSVTLKGTTPSFATISGSGNDLTLSFSGPTTINGATVLGVRNLTSNGGGTTNLAGAINTTGTQTYSEAVALTGNANLNAQGNLVSFASTVDAAAAGGQSLTVSGTGGASFASNVGSSAALSSLSVTGPTTLTGNVTTTGGQTYTGGLTLGTDTTLASTSGGAINVGTSLTGAAHDLAIASSGTTTLTNATGLDVFTAGTGGTTSGSITAATYNLNGGTVNAALGTGTLNQAAGTTTLNGTSAATSINVDGGTLRIGAAERLADTATVAVATGATLDLGAAETIGSLAGTGAVTLGANTLTSGGNGTNTTFSGTISGPGGSLVKAGGGELLLSGTNTYTGGTTVSGGILHVSNAAGAGTGTIAVGGNGLIIDNVNVANTVTVNGGTVYGYGLSAQLSGDLALQGDSKLSTGFANSDFTVSGVISGSFGITKDGNNPVRLTGTNTYTGATTVLMGFLGVAGNALADGANLNLVGGNVGLSGNETIGSLTGGAGRTVFLNGNTLTTGGDNTSTTFAGTISGAGGLTKTGSGAMTLAGVNTYTGATTVNAGTLNLAGGSAIADTSAVTVNSGAALSLAASETVGSLAGSGNVALNANTLTAGSDNTSTTFSGVASGTGGLTKAGTGALTLSGTNTYTGATTVIGGTLLVGGNNIADTSAAVVNGGGTLALTGSETVGSLAGAGNVTLNGNTLTAGADGTGTTFSGVLSGTGGLTKEGAGTMTLAGANANTGATTINGGTLQVTGNSIADTAVVVVNAGGTLAQAIGTSETIGSLAGAGNVSLGNSAMTVGVDNTSTTFSGSATGTGGFIKVGTGTMTLSGASTYSGGTMIGGGTLVVANATGAGTSSIGVGANTLRVSGVTIGNAVTVNGGTVDGVGSAGLSGNVTLAATSTFNASTASDSLAVSGVVGGVGGLVKTGAGTVTLSGTNTYGGATTVNAGTLAASGGAAIGDASAVTVGSGATLAVASSETIGSLAGSGAIDLGASTLTTGGNGGSTTFSGVIGGTGGLAKEGTGNFTLSGANTFGGATDVNAGTLTVSSGSALSDTAAVNVAAGSTLAVATSETVGTANVAGTVSGAGTLTAGTYNLSGATITGNLGTGTLNSTGTTALDGTAAAGTVNVNGGTLALGPTANRLTGATTVTIASGATLDTGTASQSLGSAVVTNAGTLTTGGALSAGSVTSTGTANLGGNVSTTGAQAYSGSVSTAAGSTLAAGSGITASGATVGSNTTLQSGTGTIDVAGNFTGSVQVTGGATTIKLTDSSAATPLVVNQLAGASTANVVLASAGPMTIDAAGMSPLGSLSATTTSGSMQILNSSTLHGGQPGLLVPGGIVLTVGQGDLNSQADPLVLNPATPPVTVTVDALFKAYLASAVAPAPAPTPAPAPAPTPVVDVVNAGEVPVPAVFHSPAAADAVNAELARWLAEGQGKGRALEDLALFGIADVAGNGRPVGFGQLAIRLPRCTREQSQGQACEK